MKILVIGDIHGNADALKAVIDNEKFDAVWFLGDFTDYGPEPDVVYDYLKDLKPEVWIMGNHDYANAHGVDCRCGEKTHDLSVYTRMEITQKLLDKEVLRDMRMIPIKKELKTDFGKTLFVHGCPRDPLYGYMTFPEEGCLKNEIGRNLDLEFLVYGHTHIPLVTGVWGMKFLNPGSVGQPRDGDPRASYAIYDDGTICIKRVKYDIDRVVGKIKKLNLKKEYEKRVIAILRKGIV